MMETLLRDLRYAGRALARRPWFTGVVVLTLALGIGANTAVFSIINAFLLRPLPGVYEPGRLVHLFGARDGDPARYSFSYPAYQDYQAASTSLSGLAAWAVSPVSVGEGEPGAEATALLVSENFFRVAGVRPALGRFPTADESSTPGAAPVVMLGYAAWQRRFGGDPHVLGRTIRVNGFPFTVIGVTPRDFGGMVPIFAPDVWVPLMMANQVKPGADRLGDRKIAWLSFTGRLGAGATLASTAARLQAAARELGRTAPDPNRGDGVTVAPAAHVASAGDPGALGATGLLAVVAGLVLMIACSNVAAMLLGRAAARRKELAIRLAVGATRARIVRQMLTETLVLFVAGGAAGLAVAVAAVRLLTRMQARMAGGVVLDWGLDGRVLVFALLVSLLTGCAFGLVPALSASRPEVTGALKDEPGSGFGGKLRARRAFVVAQVAMSALLLVAAGLFLRSLRSAQAVDLGFDPSGVAFFSLDLDARGYDEPRARDFYLQLVERVRALPGVEAVGLASALPLGGSAGRTEVRPDRAASPDARPELVGFSVVDAGYARALKLPLAAGRAFTDGDRLGAPPVVMVNQAFAARYWPGQNPVGRRVRRGSVAMEVVGVVRDGKYESLDDKGLPYVYLPLAQHHVPAVVAVVRLAGARAGVATRVRDEVAALDPALVPGETRWLSRQVDSALAPRRAGFQLTGLLGALGLLLSAVGVYGVVAYSVEQRTRELGIRMAVGAQPGDVVRLIVKQGLGMAGKGIVAGLVLGAAGARVLSHVLVGVSPNDPATLLGVAALLTCATAAASYLPARRATRIDPMTALRNE